MLRLKLGRVLVGEVHDIPEALAQYRAVYEADGENADAIAALESLYRQTQAWPDLLGIYEKKRDLATSPDDKRAINYEIAKLYETEVQDVDKAIETYVSVLEEEPTDVSALAALDVLYGRLERWEPYVDVLRRRIELDNDEEIARSTSNSASDRRSRSTPATPPARSRTTARSSSSTRNTRGRRPPSKRC